ncbi:MAG: HDIG domain-containing protein, partial [Chloroflexi bacterium]|nr:HDIG domain-containing protein [Chloroflexota bacterium]
MTDLTPYAGRWVALADDQAAGVGHTATEALRLAQRNRPKERFTLRFVEEPGGKPLALSPLMTRLRPFLAQQDRPIYLVGGAVRDALLNRISHDLDFVVPNRAIKLAFNVADALGAPAYVLDRERDTGRVVLPDESTMLDFARFRGGSLTADLRDRDFTINAIALPAGAETANSLIDPCNGVADLQAGVIRQTHERAIDDDPIRALRGLRLALGLDFALAEETAVAITTAAPLLQTVSVERVRDELLKLMSTAVPHEALRQMSQLGLLDVVLPEIAALRDVAQSTPHHEPVLAHTISVLRWLTAIEAIVSEDNGVASALAPVAEALGDYRPQLVEHLQRRVDGGLDGRAILRLSAIFHDVGKKETQTVEEDGRIRFLGHDKTGAELVGPRLRHLALSAQAIKQIKRIVAGHMRPLHMANQTKGPSRRAIFRYFRDTGGMGL